MNEEQLHEEFEKIASKHPRLSKIRLMRNKLDRSKYFYDEVQSAYDMFKASRENLIVELPDPFSLCDGYGEGVDLEDVKESLSSQGIKWK